MSEKSKKAAQKRLDVEEKNRLYREKEDRRKEKESKERVQEALKRVHAEIFEIIKKDVPAKIKKVKGAGIAPLSGFSVPSSEWFHVVFPVSGPEQVNIVSESSDRLIELGIYFDRDWSFTGPLSERKIKEVCWMVDHSFAVQEKVLADAG